MNTFRTIKNVPDYYVENSRDFQLFCNLLDSVTNSIIMDAENIHNVNSPYNCYGALLPLMAKKLGIFNLENTPTYLLRPILQSFIKLRQAKGTRACLMNMMNMYMRATSNTDLYDIKIYNKVEEIPSGSGIKPYTILIQVYGKYFDTSLLDKLLYYLKPTGYIVQWLFASESNLIESNIYVISDHERAVLDNGYNALLKYNNSEHYELDDIHHGVDTINLYKSGDPDNPPPH